MEERGGLDGGHQKHPNKKWEGLEEQREESQKEGLFASFFPALQ